MLTEIKPTELAEAHVLHQDIIALQEATKITEVQHLEVGTTEAIHHQESEARNHQLRQEHQRTEILVVVPKVTERPEARAVGVTNHTEVLRQEALVVRTEVQAVQEAITHRSLQVALGLIHLEAEADDKQNKS